MEKGDIAILMNLYKMDPFRSVHQGVSRFFKDKRLIQLFDRYATYNGSNPFKAPATLNIISYVEYGLGGYYIKGGMYRLVEALEDIAIRLGVEIHKSTKVDKIIWKNKQIKGLLVENQDVSADYVLCGADVVVAHNLLIDGLPSRRKKLNRLEPSLSGMVFLWGINKQNNELKHHNIIFSGDYKHEFDQIFRQSQVPDDPTIYISITSKSDPYHAPKNCENWFVLLNMPYICERNKEFWHNEINRMKDSVLDKLRKIGIDVSNNIEVERINTPITFLDYYSSNKGSIYGVSSNSRSMAFRRSPNRSRDIKGLYFAGGSVHPGGGIPLVLSSGKLSAELIAESAKQ
jgi:phytoene desaturase